MTLTIIYKQAISLAKIVFKNKKMINIIVMVYYIKTKIVFFSYQVIKKLVKLININIQQQKISMINNTI